MTKPKIFNVMVYRPNSDGTFKLDVHHVAAFTSAEAEETITECDPAHIVGMRFINTDDLMDVHPNRTELYVTRYTTSDAVTERELHTWVESHTKPHDNDGDTHPASHRQF